MVIAPAATTSRNATKPLTRNSMAIRAKLRPLLNEERIQQTDRLMKELEGSKISVAKVLNKRKSMSKRVVNSF